LGRAVLITLVVLCVAGLQGAKATEEYERVGVFPILSLVVEPSARASGMAGCAITLSDDSASAIEHPASLAFMEGRVAVSTSYIGLASGMAEGYTYRHTGAAVQVGGSFVIGASYVDLPLDTFSITGADQPGGNPIEIETGERCIALAGARRWGNLGVGVGLQHIRYDGGENIYGLPGPDEIVYGGWRWSVGARYEHVIGGGPTLAAAAGIRHAGPDLDAPDWGEFELPAGVSGGGSIRLGELSPAPVAFHVQFDGWLWPDSDDAWHSDMLWRFGCEAGPARAFGTTDGFHCDMALRSGYLLNAITTIDGWTLGGSLSFVTVEDIRLALDIANLPPRENENGDRLWQVGVGLVVGL